MLNNTKKTRFKIATFLMLFLGFTTIYSLSIKNTEIAGQTVTALMVTASTYVFGDSFRKS